MRTLLTLPRAVYLHHLSLNSNANGLVSGSVVCHRGKYTSEVGTAVDQTGKCGCVCQFQVNVTNEGTILGVEASTRKLVLGQDGMPLQTSTGRLMLFKCDCQVNNTISSVLASQCAGKPLDYVANEVFSPAATPEFHRTIMRNLGLPSEKERCLKLVERAAVNAFTGRSLQKSTQQYPLGLANYTVDVGAFSMDPDDLEEEEESEELGQASSFADWLDEDSKKYA